MKMFYFVNLILLTAFSSNAAVAQTQTPTSQQSTSTVNTRQNAAVKKTSLRQRMKQEARQNGSRAGKRREKMMADSLKRG